MAVKSAPSTANSASNGMQGQFPYYAEAITPSDVDTWAQPVMVYVGGSGDVRVMPWGAQSAVTFAGVSGGSMLPVCVRAILATGTTATGLLAVC